MIGTNFTFYGSNDYCSFLSPNYALKFSQSLMGSVTEVIHIGGLTTLTRETNFLFLFCMNFLLFFNSQKIQNVLRVYGIGMGYQRWIEAFNGLKPQLKVYTSIFIERCCKRLTEKYFKINAFLKQGRYCFNFFNVLLKLYIIIFSYLIFFL